MAVAQRELLYTFEQYLEMERDSETKHEYVRGHIYGMAGGSRFHDSIGVNVVSELRFQLKGHPCEAHGTDLKVYSPTTHQCSYPDVSVVCGEPRFHDKIKDTLLNPVVMVEVLSPSTSKFDQGDKFHNYCGIESFREYVLIWQDRPRVEHRLRQADDTWLLTILTDLSETLHLISMDCAIPLAEIYDRVTFAAEETTQE